MAYVGHAIAAVSSTDGRLEVFVSTGSGSGDWVNHAYQTQPGIHVPWVWQTQDNVTGEDFVAGKDVIGRIFAAGINNGSIEVAIQNHPGSGFLPKVRLATTDLHGLRVSTDQDGRVEFFAISNQGVAWSTAETAPGNFVFANHDIGGTKLIDIQPTPYSDGRLALVALGGDHSVYWISQVGPNSDWGDWGYLGGTDIQAVAAAPNADGRLEVMALGKNGFLYDRYQLTGGGWSGWEVVATGPFTAPLNFVSNADGRLEVMLQNASQQVVHTWQIAPNGVWQNGAAVISGLPSGSQATARMPDGRIVIATANSGEQPFENYDFPPTYVAGEAAPGSSVFVNWGGPPVVSGTGPPKPHIDSFTASPDGGYIAPGSRVSFSWSISNCGADCSVSLAGLDDCTIQNLVNLSCSHAFFDRSVSGQSSAGFTPQNETSQGILTASNVGGIDTSSIRVQWDQSKGPTPACAGCQWFYFKIVSTAEPTLCTKDAYFEPSSAAADTAAKNEWPPPDWSVDSIEVDDFNALDCS
jgi:hypothetical protein